MTSQAETGFHRVLESFPGDAFLRVYHAERDLSADEARALREGLTAFLAGWAAHERPVAGAFELLENRFLVVAADESKTVLSGCSKDALTTAVRALGARLGVELVHAPPICFRSAAGGLRCVERAAFRELVERGEVDADTRVFDLTIDRVRAFRDGGFELPAAESWHARAFKKLARS